MKKILTLCLFSAFVMASCQSQNPATSSENMTGTTTQATIQHSSSGASLLPEETPLHEQKLTKIDLKEDVCIREICLEAKYNVYQAEDGTLLQSSLILDKTSPEETEKAHSESKMPKKEYSVIESLEWKLVNEDEQIYDFDEQQKRDEWINNNPELAEKYSVIVRMITLSADKKNIKETFNATFTIEDYSYIQFTDDILGKKYESGWCGARYTVQEFTNTKTGQKLAAQDIFDKIPKRLERLPFLLTFDPEKTSHFVQMASWVADMSDSVYSFEDAISIEQAKNLDSKIIESAIGQSAYYVFQFSEYPGIHFVYKNNLPVADRYLTGTLVSVPLNDNKEIISLEDTKKVLAEAFIEPFSKEKDQSIEDIGLNIRKKWDSEDIEWFKIKDITEKHLPMLRIITLRDNEALVYLNPKYETFTLAELCKPVVYVYDQQKTPNALSVNLPQWGKFTKLIPQFSHNTTWDFHVDARSKISLANQQFDYLYYSARVPNYQFNQNGWQVYGRDIIDFLSQKLDYIGFNETEKNDFLDFWKTEFHADQLYFVSFKFDEEIEKYAELHFDRKPHAQMRVLLEVYPLRLTPHKKFLFPNATPDIDKKLLKKFHRSGQYDVFEWGGVVQKDFNGELIVR